MHRELSDIQAILNWAVKKRYIVANPIAGYKKPKRDDAIILPPSLREIEAVLKHAPDQLLRSLLLGFYTGLRPGKKELFSLTWADVQFDENVILVRSARKGGLKFRMVPIHEDLLPFLSKWHQIDGLDSGPIIRYRGRPVGSVKTAWRTAKTKAGITRRMRLYDFRHAFASYTLKGGGDLKATSEILGHSRTDTTSRIYQHTDSELHRDTVKRLPKIKVD